MSRRTGRAESGVIAQGDGLAEAGDGPGRGGGVPGAGGAGGAAAGGRVPLRELMDDRLLDALLERSRDEAGGLRLTGVGRVFSLMSSRAAAWITGRPQCRKSSMSSKS